MVYCLRNHDKKKKSVQVQYRCNDRRPNYIVHIYNNITIFKKKFFFDLQLVES